MSIEVVERISLELPTAVSELYKTIDEKDKRISEVETELDYYQKLSLLYNKKYLELCNFIDKENIKVPFKLEEVNNESD